jgi:adenosine deaminase
VTTTTEGDASVLPITEYLRLLPKAELHCHFVSTMRMSTLIELAERHGVELRTTDVGALLEYRGLPDFLDVFNAAHAVLTSATEISRVAYEGVEDAVRDGNLRYREYFVNPDNFAPLGIDYPTLIDAMIDGLRTAESDYGVGFRIVVAINRSLPASAAVALVEQMLAHPRPEVVGIGQDDLTPELTEDPLRFRDAYLLAERHGLHRTAHVGETMSADPRNVLAAIDELHVERIDHGYRAVDDPEVLERALASGVAFTCTPSSTRLLSGWEFTPEHRIAAMVRAGLRVTLATDDAVFFRADIGGEYADALPAMGLVGFAAQIARTGFEAAWCDDAEKTRYLRDADGAALALSAALERTAR